MESIKLKSFWVPFFMGLIGQVFHHYHQDPIAGVCWGIAGVMIVFIFYWAYLLYKIDARRSVTDFLHEYMKLSDQEKTELGINAALERVEVRTTFRDSSENYQGETREKLPQGVTPARFMMFLTGIATMYLEGGQTDQGFSNEHGIHSVNFSYDLWGRPGKLFSQPIYKSLLEWLESKNYIEKNGREFWVTESGVDFFLEKAGRTRPADSIYKTQDLQTIEENY